ncbi:MAG: hypothetical protein H0W68_04900, partial [Gemmatimonadaceae bacterium]|nr:hypothetical protein [Gemmatimonadaceae bacterium]
MSLQITAPATLLVDQEVPVVLTIRDALGRPLSDTAVTWSSLSPQVIRVTSSGSLVSRAKGLAAGVGTLSATVEGRSQSVVLTVLPLPPSSSAVLVVESFSVVEFQYPSQPGQWHYAPRVRVRESGGGGAVAVIGYDFIIPGLGRAPPCVTYRRVERGGTLELFREAYGDYDYTISQHSSRANGTPATALITIRDGDSAPTLLTVTGPIVSGSLPTTY